MEAVLPRLDQVLGVLSFFRLWLRRPRSIGAIAPSSPRLARAMAGEIDFSKPGVVVELGGGTGSITSALLAAAPDPDELVVIEREASLCAGLAARFPAIRVIHGDARNLKALLAAAGVGPVKAIVSGLPLRSLSSHCHDAVVREAFSALATDGVFVQFTYGLADPVRGAAPLRDRFVGWRSRWVLCNLPPAALWRYRRKAETSSAIPDTRLIVVTAPSARRPVPEAARLLAPARESARAPADPPAA